MATIPFFNNINLQGLFKVTGSVDPVNGTDLVTRQFLETYVAGVRDPKDSAKVASTANVPLTGGATLTVDTVVLADGDRIFLKNQSDPSENGIYDVSGIGTAYTLTRSSDVDEDSEVTSGMYVFITGGAVNAGTEWSLYS